MKPLRMFEFIEPRDLKEASTILGERGSHAKILAGGTDIMSCWSGRTFRVACYAAGIEPRTLRCFGNPKKPKALINIKGIHGLRGVRKKGKTLRVGALTTLNELVESPFLNNGLSFLRGVIRKIGSVETRNLGTVGGNLFTHAPAAGLAPILFCLKAKGVVSDGTKEQEIPLEDLFNGFRKLNQLPRLPHSRILVEIVIPELKSCSGAGYEKTTVMVSPMSPPVASAATMVQLDPRGKTIEECRIYIGSCAPSYPDRSEKAEAFLLKKPFDEAVGKKAAEMARVSLKPVPDGYSSAAYRSEVAGILVHRALKHAVQEALANRSR